uniref:WD_REPEATS_REGION domain-containing protein n=1 Tax=Rhabditophanes sp. KR3021 TaxID=114890 RepID=A0AC35U5S6_9BILA
MGQETFRSNKISVVELDDSSNSLVLRHTLDHSFPATKVQFTPDGQSYYDLMGTTSDALRIFRISNEGKMTLLDTLHSSANLGYSGPYSSMDWNTYDPTIIGVSSNDSTCLIWQLETSQCVTISKAKVKSHLISNDKSVNEIGFMSKDTFVTASDDGSIRQFDIRDMKSSTILYDGGTEKTPLVRVQTNKKDGNLLGVLGSHSNKILIIDVRKPDRVYKTCVNPNAEINSIAWSPANKQLICSGSSDNQALIWQVKDELAEGTSTKTYNANAEISNVQWGPRHPQWISITFDKSVEILRV